jgi:hypothetical protein
MRFVLLHLFGNDVVAQSNALIADVDGGPGDELLDLLLRFSTERATQVAVRIVSSSLHVFALT